MSVPVLNTIHAPPSSSVAAHLLVVCVPLRCLPVECHYSTAALCAIHMCIVHRVPPLLPLLPAAVIAAWP